MSYHTNFWIAAAAVAPVLTLTSIVSAGDGWSTRAPKEMTPHDGMLYSRYSRLLFKVSMLGVFINGMILWTALSSLATMGDVISPVIVLFVTVVGTGLLLLTTVINGLRKDLLFSAQHGGAEDDETEDEIEAA